jgi:hypothetical protein
MLGHVRQEVEAGRKYAAAVKYTKQSLSESTTTWESDGGGWWTSRSFFRFSPRMEHREPTGPGTRAVLDAMEKWKMTDVPAV